MRKFRRLQHVTMRTAAQKRCPPDFMARILAAHAANPFPIGYSCAMVGHDPRCKFLRGGACNCVPEIILRMPDGQIATIDMAGRARKEFRQ